jgi:hypothetical protein
MAKQNLSLLHRWEERVKPGNANRAQKLRFDRSEEHEQCDKAIVLDAKLSLTVWEWYKAIVQRTAGRSLWGTHEQYFMD